MFFSVFLINIMISTTSNRLVLFMLCCFLHFLYGVSASHHPLKQRLKTWEVISGDDIAVHRERRSADGKLSTIDKEVSFNAFNRQFRMSLIPSPEVFAPNFKAAVYGRDGRTEVSVDRTSLYSGTLMGEPGSSVHAHLDGRELMASIKTKHDTYIIEPSWRHLPEEDKNEKKKSKMIVYRRSDLNMTKFSNHHKNDTFCGIESIMDEIHQHEKEENGEVTDRTEDHHRSKRANGNKRKKICTLALVADFRFYKEMGNSNYLQTIYYLINLVERVNHIFKLTDWGSEEETPNEYIGYGFQISDIKVYKESTYEPRFNSDVKWTAKELLEAFSETDHGHCLAHLFTYVDFDKGVLGLAYVGASKPSAVGGICTRPYDKGHGKPVLYFNTGLTTARNWGQRILTLEADLVTTHELGHNFGAEHDNGEVEDCSPGPSNHGNYIMYPAAVSGENENNDQFSKCSKHNVLPCLKHKAPECFHEAREGFCGNFKVEPGEQCDVGYFAGNAGEDECCTKDCKLKEGALCSSKNSVCCDKHCKAASSTMLCYSGVPDSCLKDTYCDGEKYTCPEHLTRKDKRPCGDAGECKDGKCQPYCVTVGMKACLCTDKKENFCRRCCVPIDAKGKNITTQCKPYIPANSSSFLQLRDNARCTLGYCKEGECIKQTQDVIERVWSIFEHIAPDKIGEFLADNIVGTVLVFSLLFWVPCGCLVNFVDKKREKQREKEEQWFTEKGSEFYKLSHVHGGMFGSSNTINNQMLHKSANVSGVLAARAGQSAKEQWRVSRDKATRRKSQEKIDGLNGQASNNSQEDRYGRGDGIFIKSTTKPQVAAPPPPPKYVKPKTNVGIQDGNDSNASRSSTPRPQLMRQDVIVDADSPTA